MNNFVFCTGPLKLPDPYTRCDNLANDSVTRDGCVRAFGDISICSGECEFQETQT